MTVSDGRAAASEPTPPFRFAVRSSQADSIGAWRDKARQAEDLGYFAFHVSDHVLGPGVAMERSSHPPAGLAAVPALMALADATSSLRIGARVMCLDYHHPVVLAKEMATIDLLSEGRLEVGLGAGWLTAEYEALGIPFDPAATRIDRLAEAVHLFKQLFADGPVSFQGKHFGVEGFEGAPKPVQRPHPPITIGGGSRRVLQLAAREADIVGINFDNRSGVLGVGGFARSGTDQTLQKVQWVRDGAGERRNDIEIEIGVYATAVTDDPSSVAERLGTTFGLTASDMMTHPHVLVGSVDGLCEELERRRAVYGISYFTVGEDSVSSFAPVVDRLAGT